MKTPPENKHRELKKAWRLADPGLPVGFSNRYCSHTAGSQLINSAGGTGSHSDRSDSRRVAGMAMPDLCCLRYAVSGMRFEQSIGIAGPGPMECGDSVACLCAVNLGCVDRIRHYQHFASKTSAKHVIERCKRGTAYGNRCLAGAGDTHLLGTASHRSDRIYARVLINPVFENK